MDGDAMSKLERRVVQAAEAALLEQQYVTTIDVLVGLGWLPLVHVDLWRQGRLDYLEQLMQVNPNKLEATMAIFLDWATGRGLRPTETTYVARTPDRRQLRFSASAEPAIELAYRTHWVSSELSDTKQQRVAEKLSRPPDLVVISPVKDWTCAGCSGTGDLLIMDEPGPLCMRCAKLDHLVYLPAGEAALTRRAKKASTISAVVVRFSRTRKRYERQGILVEEEALAQAEKEAADKT